MAELSPSSRRELLHSTRDKAIHFIEDLEHLRSLLTTEKITADAVRRASPVLRSWLIDRGIQTIASPRLPEIRVRQPDNKPVYRTVKKCNVTLFASLGAPAFNLIFRGATHYVSFPGIGDQRHRDLVFDADATVEVNLDSFGKQEVICFDGKWVTRANVINYVANKGGGAHPANAARPDVQREEPYVLLERVREFGDISIGSDGMALVRGGPPSQKIGEPFVYQPNRIDIVLHEMLSAAHYLLQSPDLSRLEELIKEEIGVSHQSKSKSAAL